MGDIACSQVNCVDLSVTKCLLEDTNSYCSLNTICLLNRDDVTESNTKVPGNATCMHDTLNRLCAANLLMHVEENVSTAVSVSLDGSFLCA